MLDLTTLECVGKKWQDVRTARNRTRRHGITMVTGQPAEFPADLRGTIERPSQAWVSGKPPPEMAFTLGTVDHALDPEKRTHFLVDAVDLVHGVTTWLPVHGSGEIVGWTLDPMRRRPDGIRPVMEYLLAECALLFPREGCAPLSLSVAPLARRSPSTGRRISLNRTLCPAYLPNAPSRQAAGLLPALRHNHSHLTVRPAAQRLQLAVDVRRHDAGGHELLSREANQ